jgi:nitrite reductase (NADH) small subunit
MTLLNEVQDIQDIQVWTTACAFDHLIPGRGVGVLLDDGRQAALFRLDDGSVHAIGNVDPISGRRCCRGGSSETGVAVPRCNRPS